MQLSYEAQTCSRCCGTGRYSYNQMHGDMCYGCHGRGEKDTKRGAATRAFMEAHLALKVSDLTIGDRFTAPRLYKGTHTATTIGKPVKTGRSRSGNADWVDSFSVTITNANGHELHFGSDFTLRKAATAEDITLGIEYQENLTKAGTPRKAVA